MGDIHLLATAREQRGIPVHTPGTGDPVYGGTASPPIPFRPTWLGRLFARKQTYDDIKGMGLSQEAVDEKHAALLGNWFDTASDECGVETTKAMLQSKVGLAEAILEARK